MTEKCEAQLGVTVDASQAVCGGVRYFADGVGTQVRQLLGFHVAPLTVTSSVLVTGIGDYLVTHIAPGAHWGRGSN